MILASLVAASGLAGCFLPDFEGSAISTLDSTRACQESSPTLLVGSGVGAGPRIWRDWVAWVEVDAFRPVEGRIMLHHIPTSNTTVVDDDVGEGGAVTTFEGGFLWRALFPGRQLSRRYRPDVDERGEFPVTNRSLVTRISLNATTFIYDQWMAVDRVRNASMGDAVDPDVPALEAGHSGRRG